MERERGGEDWRRIEVGMRGRGGKEGMRRGREER